MSADSCPSFWQMEQLLNEQLDEAEREVVARHVDRCDRCREALARVTEEDHDPWPPRSPSESFPAFLKKFACSPPPQMYIPEPALETPGSPSATVTAEARPSAGPASPPLAQRLVPGVRLQVPGYDILEELGRGGMGVVYKARHQVLGRLVALKMLLAGEHATPAQLTRFRTEAEALARLQHPNIVQVYEVGEQDGLPFFALELVDGSTLANRLGGVPRPPGEAARLIEELARAVHAAHQQGVVHRDLKPANILLSADDTPKISDFGLAKRLDATDVPTQSGDIVGTPSYMAPEQARGDRQAVGPASDVYGLGAILYELLTGRPPFRAVTPLDTLLQVLHEEPVPVRRLQPKVPRDLETICLKCLRKEPSQRYASAGALAEDLRRFQAGESIVARSSGLLERGLKWGRRRPAVAALIGVSTVAVLALVGIITGSFFYARLQREVERAEVNQYFHYIAAADSGWKAGSMARMEPLLDECPPHRRHWEWHYLKRLCHQDLITLRGHSSTVRCVACNANGTRIASAGWDNTVRVWDAATGDCLLTLGHTHQVWSVAFSRDGERLAAGSWDGVVKIWDAATGREVCSFQAHERRTKGAADHAVYGVDFSPDGARLITAGGDCTVKVWDAQAPRVPLLTLRGHEHLVQSVAISPDGKQLASASHDHTVKIWDATTGDCLHTLKEHTGALTDVAFSAEGTRLASCSWDSTVKVWDLRRLQEVPRTLRGHHGAVMGVRFSRDGKRLASAGGDGSVRVWEVDSGEQTLLLKGHTGGVMSVAFDADARRLVSASADGTVKMWDAFVRQEARTFKGLVADQVRCLAIRSDGASLALGSGDGSVTLVDATTWQKISAFRIHDDHVRGVAFSPDGRRLASAGRDTTVKVWDVEGKVIHTLTEHTHEVQGVAFSPDGTRLASASDDRTVKVWDLTTGQVTHTLTGHTDWVRGVAFSPDGKRLASASFDRTIRVWDPTTGEELLRLTGHTDRIWRVVYSPDGKRLASVSRDRTVKLWDAVTGQVIHTFAGHNLQVVSVAFSPDGKRLASASQDHTVKLWDTTTGHQALALEGHTGMGWGVAFSPDGHRLISVSDDGTLTVWDATPLPTSP